MHTCPINQVVLQSWNIAIKGWTVDTLHFNKFLLSSLILFSFDLTQYVTRRSEVTFTSEYWSDLGNFIFQGKVPLLSTTALHHLHIFIFVLAVVHVTFCVLTIIFGGAKVNSQVPFKVSFEYASFFLNLLLHT